MASEPVSVPVIATDPRWPHISIAAGHEALTAPGSRFEMETVAIGGIPTRVWKNAPPSLPALITAARAYGEREFVVYEDERVTYEAAARAIAALATHLQSLGVVKGDRVALAMRNLPEWPVAFFAATAIGAIMVPLNAWWTGAELEYGLTDSGAKVLIVDDERHQRLAPWYRELPALEQVIVAARGRGWRGRRDPAGGRHRRHPRLGIAARRHRSRPQPIASRRRRDDLLHQRDHRPAQGRARHPPQHDVEHPVGVAIPPHARCCDGARRSRGAEPADDADRHPAVSCHRLLGRL